MASTSQTFSNDVKPPGLIRRLLRWVLNLFRFLITTALFFGLMVFASYHITKVYIKGNETASPALTGKPLLEALETMKSERLSLLMDQTRPHPIVPEGHILSQNPPAGTRIKRGTPVRVVISSGQPQVTVPDLRGQTNIAAGIRLRRLGLEVGNTARFPFRDIEGGLVVTTDPPAGTGVGPGAKVNLFISSGQQSGLEKMPNLFGFTLEEAEELLSEYKLRLDETQEVPSARVLGGQIHQQTPAPGDPIRTGVRVTVQYAPQSYELEPSPIF